MRSVLAVLRGVLRVAFLRSVLAFMALLCVSACRSAGGVPARQTYYEWHDIVLVNYIRKHVSSAAVIHTIHTLYPFSIRARLFIVVHRHVPFLLGFPLGGVPVFANSSHS